MRSTQPAALRDRVLAGLGGVLGFWLAPLMVAAVRKTDAPPGSEVPLVTTAAWALLLVVGALFARKERPSAVQLVGVVIGVIGAAAVLANWERPSSFSPFVRFPAEEATMLAAGALWVVATRILAPLVRRVGALRTAAWALVPAAAVSVLAATAIAPASFVAMRDSAAWPLLALNALAVAALAISWTQGLRTRPSHVMAAAFLLPAPVLSALSVVEQATRAFGPVPLLWNAVLWGTAVTVAGALLLVLGPAKAAVPAIPLHSRIGLGALGVAALSSATGLAALLRPDIAVSVAGKLTSGQPFSTRFTMLGFETVGGWIALSAAVLVLVLAWDPRLLRTHAAVWAACLAVLLAAWFPLHTTHLHQWNTWIPFEVQQDYGTEYAHRDDVPLANPFEQVTLLGTAVASALLAYDRVRLGSRQHAEEVRVAGREVS